MTQHPVTWPCPAGRADMRRRHRRSSGPPHYCTADNQDWPCDATQLLDAIEAADDTDHAIAAWVRVNADLIRQAIFDATCYRDEHGLPVQHREFGRLAEQFSEITDS